MKLIKVIFTITAMCAASSSMAATTWVPGTPHVTSVTVEDVSKTDVNYTPVGISLTNYASGALAGMLSASSTAAKANFEWAITGAADAKPNEGVMKGTDGKELAIKLVNFDGSDMTIDTTNHLAKSNAITVNSTKVVIKTTSATAPTAQAYTAQIKTVQFN